MEIDKTKFSEYLACYGSDINAWPPEARLLGRRAQHHPELAGLIEQERHFERLLGEDRVASMPTYLSQRVIARSLAGPAADEPRWLFIRFPAAFLRPAALALMLMLGFAVGYGAFVPEQDDEAFLQSYSDDSGAML